MSEENKFEQAKGKVKETVGNVAGDEKLEKEGQVDNASGKAKEAVEDVKDKAEELKNKAQGVVDGLKDKFKK